MSNKQTPGRNPNRPQGQSQRAANTGGAAIRPTPGKAPVPGNGAANKPVGKPGSTAATATTAARPRTNGATTAGRRPLPQKKSGFRIRPMDAGLILVGLLIVGFIVFNALQTPPPTVSGSINPSSQPVPVGQAAPDFTLPDTTNTNYTLSSFKGKVVLLEFMATWCPHCQDDAPIVNQVYDNYKGKDVQLLAVNATPYNHNRETDAAAGKNPGPATMDDLKWFKDTYKVQYPILFDKNLDATNAYGVQGYPTVYVVGKDGKINSIPNYPFTYNDLVSAIDTALK